MSNSYRAAGCAHQRHVGQENRPFLLGNSTFNVALRIRPHVFLHRHHVLHQHLALVGKHPQHAPFFSRIPPGHHLHGVIPPDIHSLMIGSRCCSHTQSFQISFCRDGACPVSGAASRVSTTALEPFRHPRRRPHDFFQRPALELRQRPRLFDLDRIAAVRFGLLVVGVKLLPDRDHPLVHGVRLLPRHLDYDRLLHLIRDDGADQYFAVRLRFGPDFFGLARGFRHYFFSVFAPASSCSRKMVWTRAISRRSPRIFFRLSVCPIFIWNFSLKSWSAKSRSWCLSSTSVKLRIFSTFIKSALGSQLSALSASRFPSRLEP